MTIYEDESAYTNRLTADSRRESMVNEAYLQMLEDGELEIVYNELEDIWQLIVDDEWDSDHYSHDEAEEHAGHLIDSWIRDGLWHG